MLEYFSNFFSKSSLKDMFTDFRKREEGRGREERKRGREKNINVREKHASAASCMHPNQGSNPKPFCVGDSAPTN